MAQAQDMHKCAVGIATLARAIWKQEKALTQFLYRHSYTYEVT